MSSCQDALFDREDNFRVYEPCLNVRFTADNLEDCINFLNADLKRRGHSRDQCEALIQVRVRDRWMAVNENLYWDKIRGCEPTILSSTIMSVLDAVSSFLTRSGDSPTQKK